MLSKAIQKIVTVQTGKAAVYEESIVLSQININFISVIDRGHHESLCREKLCEYLGRKGLWKTINDLFSEVYPDTEKESSQLSWVEKVDLLEGRNRPHTGPFQGGLAGGYGDRQLHFNTAQGLYLDLQEFILLEKDAHIDRDFFPYFFAFRLSKRELSEVNNFFIVNFTTHFNSEINPFMDFCRHVLIPKHKSIIGTQRISMIRAFLKKIQRKAPYVRIKEVKIIERPLEEFFAEGYNGKKNAELFRTKVVHQLLERDGKQIPGAKGKLNMVVNALFYKQQIWRQDLQLKTIADTLRQECHFKTLNSKGLQKDQIKEVDQAIERALDSINWIKSA